jgi:ABC-type transport system involved in multi-copper enzyme maturation permease subunit
MKSVVLLAMAFVRHNLWLLIMLMLWPWLFSGVLSFEGENQINDYAANLQQESFYGILIIGFMATAALNNEQKSRRIIAVLSKAVSRGEYLGSFLLGVLVVGLGFTFSVAIATWIATLRIHPTLVHLPVFLFAVLIAALWIASLSLMFSTFLPPLPTTIFTGLGVGITLLGLHSSNSGWALLAPTSSIFHALAADPLSPWWRLGWLPLAGATVEISVFLAIGAWAFQYRDLTRALE